MRGAIALLAVLAAITAVHADEGMWQPRELPALAAALESLGMEIDPEALADLTSHPMNAVISLGGCTASFVSPDGLIVTNHHCAERSIQHNSTVERNLLETGFLAARRDEELPAAPGTKVWITVRVEDVTGPVTEGLDAGLDGRERYRRIEDRKKNLVARCESDEGHRCDVYAFHGGLEYHLIKKMEVRDVRLAYAPSRSIGVYGGDVDNWMWPRHTGDFAFYRAYVGPDGRPAGPSEENVPLKPAHHLKVSAEGVAPGDFVMAVGYPGSTSRHRLATEVESAFEWYYPTRKRLFQQWLDIIDRETEGRPEARIRYASLVAGLNNAVKNYDGMMAGFAKSDIVQRKKQLERDLQHWIDSDPDHGARHHSAVARLREVIGESRALRERRLHYESMVRRGTLFSAARQLYRLSREKEKADQERDPKYQQRNWDRIRSRLERIDRTYDEAVDRAAWKRFILDYASLPESHHVRKFDDLLGIRGSRVDEAALEARLEEMYAGTRLHLGEERLGWMESPRARFEKSDDPFIRLAVALHDSDMALEEERKALDGKLDAARPRYMEALIAFLHGLGRPVYADANGTLRVTYGSVKGYSPRDGVAYAPFTTLAGVAEKHTGEAPFDAPAALLQAAARGSHGRYADPELGDVPVNFLSTLDSTGGNSGSATLNGRAELVGLLFDGNWESIISDWDFMPDLTRSIHVDIRYTLWVMDRLDGADHLLEEMGLSPDPERSAALLVGE